MAGGYLAIGGCISSMTSNQVIAFVVSQLFAFYLMLVGYIVLDFFFLEWADYD